MVYTISIVKENNGDREMKSAILSTGHFAYVSGDLSVGDEVIYSYTDLDGRYIGKVVATIMKFI